MKAEQKEEPRKKYQRKLHDTLDHNWAELVLGRRSTRRLMAFLTMTPRIKHRKKDLPDKIGTSTASFYRALADLNNYGLIEEEGGMVRFRWQTPLGKALMLVGLSISQIEAERDFQDLTTSSNWDATEFDPEK